MQEQQWSDNSVTELQSAGIDQVSNYWLNSLYKGHYIVVSLHSDSPAWLSEGVDQGNTHQWLHSAGVKATTEGFIMAAPDQSLIT